MRAIPSLKISISGVRGVIGDSLSPTLLTRFAQAFGTYAGSGTIVIGRDTRTSGEMVRQAVIAGLVSSGCRVIDLDIVPVPTVQLLVRQRKAHGGIAITASHNPAEWNALKFVGADGLFLSAGQARELLDIYHQGDYTKVVGAEMRQVESFTGAAELHIKAILDVVGPLPPTPQKIKVALDSCNGASSQLAPQLLAALGAEVVSINTTPDGLFPRGAEPIAENIGALCQLVKDSGAVAGFAQDMDADRLAVVAECGEPVGEDNTLVLATHYVLGKTPGPNSVVVTNLSTSMAMDDVVRLFNGTLHRSKIGEANVTELMQQTGAVIGGEGNGGVIYPKINFCRDSHVGMALILHLLAESGKTISQLLTEQPRYRMVKEKLECPSDKISEVLKLIRREFADYEQDLRDGVKVTLPQGWLHVRGSNTEPIIRLVAEAGDEAQARAILDTVFTKVSRLLAA
ncbi:MAG: phosphoglucosamine mutase [Acidobacteria bacterium]|nr:phosphoglucosamine mutase [Acidobacteriota bacterium]MBI3421340.1 phosphoglucosamine mutase [Acidobacteriota bacterium]